MNHATSAAHEVAGILQTPEERRLHFATYGPLKRSSWRRSRLVGRPAPGSRLGIRGCRFTTGAGGLWSIRFFAATAAPTRFSMMPVTSRTRGRSMNASTRSPTFTCVDAFAGARFTRTWPPRQAAVAAERDLYSRTAHSQTSTRVVSIGTIVPA